MRRLLLALTCVGSLAGSSLAFDRHVPSVYPTIQAGINAALPGDDVVVQGGVYPEGINFNAKAITVRGVGTVEIRPPSGPGVQFTSGEGPGSVLENVDIIGASGILGGGGIIGVNASPRLILVEFRSNTALFGGGLVINSGASPFLEICEFFGNGASNDGGGVECLPGSSPTFEECRFINNIATGAGGGLHGDDADITIMRGFFRDSNRADLGGALAIEGGTLDYTGPGSAIPEIQRNSADTSGGAFYFTDGAVASLSRAQFDDNTAAINGGGVAVTGGATVTMTDNCVLERNDATNGGGLAVLEGFVTVVEGAFEVNTASGAGGGVFVVSDDAAATADIVQSRFFFNQADDGGAVSAQSVSFIGPVPSTTVLLSNCIIDRNFSTDPSGSGGVHALEALAGGVQTTLDIRSCTITENTGGAVNGVRGEVSPRIRLFNSIVWNNDGTNVANTAVGLTDTGYSIFPEFASYPGPGNFNADPMFSTEAFTLFELLPGSPARDAGSNDEAALDTADVDGDSNTGEPLETDFSGIFAFPVSGRFENDGGVADTGVGPAPVIDIGAQEAIEGTPCSEADIDSPLGVLDFNDVLFFLVLFDAMNSGADLAPPFGVWDFGDVLAFLTAFGGGCPG